MRFNQPVRPADVLAHLGRRSSRTSGTVPTLPAAGDALLRGLTPGAVEAFTAKVERVLPSPRPARRCRCG